MERLSDDQVAESAGLDALAAQAAEVELQAVPPGERPPTEAQISANTAAELLAALTMVRMMVAPGMAWFDRFDETWSDQQLQKISESGAAVLDLHGITMGGLFDRYGPYIALAGATLPPALVTYQAVKLRQLELKKQKTEAPDERAQQAPH